MMDNIQSNGGNWQFVIIFSLFCIFFVQSCQIDQQVPHKSSDLKEKPSTSVAKVDSIFETFEYEDKDKDTTYLMKKYYVCFLKTGPIRDQDEATAAQIQKDHLAHMSAQAAAKKICASGPMGDDGDIKGIVVYSVANQAEVDSLANSDPAVKAGRLVVEIHPWWAAVGTTLF